MSEAKVQLTPQRRAVLQVVRDANDHPSANEIYQRVQTIQPGIAYSTVYNALNVLVAGGLIQELKIGDQASRYDGRTETHHHALCLGCGILAEVEMALTERQWSEVAEQTGFAMKNYHIQFTGYCPQCRAKQT